MKLYFILFSLLFFPLNVLADENVITLEEVTSPSSNSNNPEEVLGYTLQDIENERLRCYQTCANQYMCESLADEQEADRGASCDSYVQDCRQSCGAKWKQQYDAYEQASHAKGVTDEREKPSQLPTNKQQGTTGTNEVSAYCKQNGLTDKDACNTAMEDPDFKKKAEAVDKVCKDKGEASDACTQYAQAVKDGTISPSADDPEESGPTVDQQAKDAVDLLKTCTDTFSKANRCCQNTVMCLSDNLSGGEVAGIAALGGIGVALATGDKGYKQRCELYKKLGTVSSAANIALAGACAIKKNSCENTCEDVAQKIETMKESCERRYEGKRADDKCYDLDKVYRRAAAQVNRCGSLSENLVQISTQAAQAIVGTKYAADCEEAAAAEEANEIKPFNPIATPAVDCNSVANLSNPICQLNCSRPGAQADPLCRNLAAEDDDDGDGSGARADLGGDGGLIPDDDDETLVQDPLLNMIDPQQQSANVGNRGGGGIPQGGASGGLNPSGGGSGKQSGYDTNVLKGTTGGNGFSNKFGGSGYMSGGGYTYGGRKGGRSAKGGKAFNLKDYLPGQKKDPKRKLAGLNGSMKASQINGKHTDGWEKITKRYQAVCSENRLWCRGKK